MATAEASSSSASVETGAAGVCAPADFPETQIRSLLDRAGHPLAFWLENLKDAVKACQAQEPEFLVLGVRRVDPDSLERVRGLLDEMVSLRVVIVCERSSQGDVRKALDAGARGVVALRELDEALPAVIAVVRAGQVSVPGSRGTELRRLVLTSREKQILGLVVMGMSNAEIAGKLYLAESTIKSHLSSAFAKLGVSSRNEAANMILDSQNGAGLGILTIPTQ